MHNILLRKIHGIGKPTFFQIKYLLPWLFYCVSVSMWACQCVHICLWLRKGKDARADLPNGWSDLQDLGCFFTVTFSIATTHCVALSLWQLCELTCMFFFFFCCCLPQTNTLILTILSFHQPSLRTSHRICWRLKLWPDRVATFWSSASPGCLHVVWFPGGKGRKPWERATGTSFLCVDK